MDVLPRITRPLIELLRAMSLVQRVTVVALPALILSGMVWLVVVNRPADFQAVLFGKTFASDELAVAEQALHQAGLLNYRREDRKLLAPAAELDRYNAALVGFDAVPPDLGSQLLKQFETLGPFSTDRQRQEMKDALLLQELRRMIKSVPDIDEARVTVASSGRRVGFGQKPRVTANVTVKPRAGRELSQRLVGSLRQAVASMVPDLMPADVTVFDVARGQAYTGEQADDPLDGRLIQRVREFTRQYEQQIQQRLAFIPNATVAVHVDLDHLKSSVIRQEQVGATSRQATISETILREMPIANRPEAVQQIANVENGTARHTSGFRGSASPSDALRPIEAIGPSDVTREISEHELLAAMPRAVQVSISIPRDYYRGIAARRNAQRDASGRPLDLDSIEEEVLTKVERTVGRLIPAGSSPNAISVTTVDRMTTESTEPVLTTVDQLGVLARRHGGSCALGLFAVWALWMLSRWNASPRAATATSTSAPVSNTPASESPVPTMATLPSAAEPTTSLFSLSAETPSPAPSEPAVAVTRRASPDMASEPWEQHFERSVSPESMSRASSKTTVMERAALPGNIDRRGDTQRASGPFAFLADRPADEIRSLLIAEQSQTIAVIAAQLPASVSAAVLTGFPPDRQADVLQRVTQLGPTDPAILCDIAIELKARMGRQRVRSGGDSHAAAVPREPSHSSARSMRAGLDERDADLADELRQTLFTFDDLLKLDDVTLQVILRETDDRPWALALKASPVAVRQKVMGCLPPPVALAFRIEMESLGPVRLSEMTSVRQQIANSIRLLEDAGRIALPLT